MEPVASTSAQPYEQRGESPSHDARPTDLDQRPPVTRPGKRKLSPDADADADSSTLTHPDPSSSSSTPHLQADHNADADDDATGDESGVAPVPQFAPPPPTLSAAPGFEFFATRSHPFNKHGFRYTPCGPSVASPLPVAPQRQIEAHPRTVRWSWEDRSVFTYVTPDAATVTTDKGWRAARANVPVRTGTWYWEFRVDRGGGDSADGHGHGAASWVRVGVGRRESGLNAPAGVDGYSYAIRDRTGDKVHTSHATPYAKPFASGATIGVYLSIPSPPPAPASASASAGAGARDPRKIMRKRVPIRYKNQLYFEQLEYSASKEMDELLVDPALKAKQDEAEALKRKKSKLAAAPGTKHDASADRDAGPPLRELLTLPDSRIAFSIDGEFHGVAFEDLYDFIPLIKPKVDPMHKKKEKTNRLVTENHHDDGSTGYYPFVSVFGGGTVTLNPGPTFAFPPTDEEFDQIRRRNERAGGRDGDDPAAPKWRPLCDRYAEFYEEQARLDDLDELEQIKLLADARAKELAKVQRQFDKAERAAAAAYEAAGGGATKKAKLSSSTTTIPSMAAGAVAASSNAETTAILGHLHSQVIGKAKGQEESPGNSPRPGVLSSSSDQGVKLETL
ncbi:hypothetical protein JCM11491_006623 [Sporobolomyces phaffii]